MDKINRIANNTSTPPNPNLALGEIHPIVARYFHIEEIRQAARRVSSIEGLKLGKSLFCLPVLPMSNANSQDSLKPKPLTEGIDEITPRQLAPSLGILLVKSLASADVSSPASIHRKDFSSSTHAS